MTCIPTPPIVPNPLFSTTRAFSLLGIHSRIRNDCVFLGLRAPPLVGLILSSNASLHPKRKTTLPTVLNCFFSSPNVHKRITTRTTTPTPYNSTKLWTKTSVRNAVLISSNNSLSPRSFLKTPLSQPPKQSGPSSSWQRSPRPRLLSNFRATKPPRSAHCFFSVFVLDILFSLFGS